MRCPHCATALADRHEHDLPFRLLRCAGHGCFVAGEDLEPAMTRALKRDLHKAPATTLDCPMCGSLMRQQATHGLVLDVCEVCDGVWFDKGELDRAPAKPDDGAPARWTYSPLDGVAEGIKVVDRELKEETGWFVFQRVLRWI